MDPLAAARALARRMYDDGAEPLDITLSVLRALALGRVQKPGALDLVRELPGLADYRVLEVWEKRRAA